MGPGRELKRNLTGIPEPNQGPEPESERALTPTAASRFAQITLACVWREYPNKMDHILHGPEDVRSPKQLHPSFYGCFDWHSAVHGHWMLAKLLRTFPDLPEAEAIRAVLDVHLAPERLRGEVAYFRHPGHFGFERTYGWAWLLKLAAELADWDAAEARTWSARLQPLADAVVERFHEFLPRQTYPIRTGTHGNTAFSLNLALDYARTHRDTGLEALLVERARTWFLKDGSALTAGEPGGEDFLSPFLEEAAFMARILPARGFRAWVKPWLPELRGSAVLIPARVSDRSDPRIVHLDGLNLSRARALQTLAAALGPRDPMGAELQMASHNHGAAALPQVASGQYCGEHWLATFAVRLLEASPPAAATRAPDRPS